MSIRTHIYLILICLSVACSLNAQTGIIGNEKYNSYEQYIYVDNLDQKLIPEIFVSTYYSDFKTSDFTISQVIDTIYRKKEMHIRTQKAKDGYLFINKAIMDKIKDFHCNLDGLKVLYVYNEKAIATKKDVMRILRLRAKHIQIPTISHDKQSGVISVYIFDK